MASFAEELSRAAEKLERAADKIEGSAGGPGGGGSLAAAAGGRGGGGGLGSLVGGLSGGRSFMAAAGPAGLALAGAGMAYEAAQAGARFFTPAATAFAVTGSSQSFASAVTQSTLGMARDNAFGGLILGATGISAAMDTNERAGGNVKSTTDDLARIGINLSDKQIQRMFDAEQEREKRVTEMRGRVDAIAGSAEELKDGRPKGAGEGFDRVIAVLERIEGWMRSFKGGA